MTSNSMDVSSNIMDVQGMLTNPQEMNQDKPVEVFSLIFFLLLDSMQTRQDTVLNESKLLSANANAQNMWNMRDGNIKFAILPEGADQAQINRYQDLNQQYAAIKDGIRDQLITARQVAQVLMTKTSTDVNYLQEYSTEDSEFLKLIKSIFSVINDINKPQ